MALNNLSSSLIQDTYEKLVQTEGGLLADGSGSAIDSLTVTASYATQALTASFALNADPTDTGSLMTTGSISGNTLTFTKGDNSTFDIDLSGISVDTGSFMTTGSITDATITFTKGDGTTFDIVVPDTDISALNAFTASADARLDSLEAETGSLQTQINNINTAVGGLSASAETGDLLFENVYGEVYGTSTAPVGGNITISASSTKVDGATVIVYHSGSIEPTVSGGTISKKTGIYDTSGATNVITFVRDTDSKFIQYIAGAGVSSVASASYAGNAELLDNLDSSAFAQVGQNNTFTGTQTFNNIAVNGTGSFAYIEQITGSAKVIGDAFIILNNDTPTQRYAGVKVIDSGSAQATASIQFDGQTNDWFYEYEKAGDPDDFAVFLAGPEYGTIGSPVYPTANQIQKGRGDHHLTGSLLFDDGSTVSMTGTFDVTGAVSASAGFKGNLDGNAATATTATTATSASHAVQADSATSATSATTATSASHALQADNATTADSATTATTASYVAGGNVDGTVANATSANSATSASYATSGSFTQLAAKSENNNTNSGSIAFWQGTQTEYNLISGSATDDTIYFVI